jgi:acyl-coenzyme A thioesterase PaaI-like protein
MGILDGDNLSDDHYCFACGRDNPIGLKMSVGYPEGEARCAITLAREWQGWAGIAHGGVAYTLLDEIMAHAVIHHVGGAVTVGAEVKYRAPVPIGEELLVRGWVAEVNGRRVRASAEVTSATGGRPMAQATATFLLQKD